nr:proteasome A-type subunit-like protein [Cryptomonas sp.]
MVSYSLTTFNQDGRLTQIDNALKAVIFSNTVVALKSKNCGVLIAMNNSNNFVSEICFTPRVFIVNNKIGIAGSGLYPDLRLLVKRARRQAKIFQSNFGEEISSRELAKEMSSFIQEFTQAGGVRVFGVSLFVVGFDMDGPNLYQIDPSGMFLRIKGGAIGKNADIAMEIIKKRLSESLDFNDICSLAFIISQETSDVPLSKFNVHFAAITEKCIFKIYSSLEVEAIIKKKKSVL